MPTGVAGALAIQPNTTSSSIAVVRNGGTVVTISGDQVARPPRGVVVAGLPYHVDVSGELADLVRQICSRQIHLEIEKIYAFDDAIAALNKVQTRHARGKIVLSFE